MSERRVLFVCVFFCGVGFWYASGQDHSPAYLLAALLFEGLVFRNWIRERWNRYTLLAAVAILLSGISFAVLGYLFRDERPPLLFRIILLTGVVGIRLVIGNVIWNSLSQPAPNPKKPSSDLVLIVAGKTVVYKDITDKSPKRPR